MSLLTLERSSPSPHESENDDLLSTSSYEGFVAREHYAMCLTPRPITSLGPCRRGDHIRIFSHLKKLVKLLRPQDMLKLAVELENGTPRKVTKYMVVIVTVGNQDTEETIVLGTEQEGSSIRLGLVLPLWRDTEIKLDGDGGFSVHTGDRQHIFKPLSVQSMWTALQTLYKCTEKARMNNYYVGGLSHTWMTHYNTRLTTDGAILNEWNWKEDVESFRPDSPIYTSDASSWNEESVAFEKLLSHKLRGIMLEQDLEEITSKQLRLLLENEMKLELKDYREFLDRQMLRILGQMERPSEIYDYLYLGSEWNASNLSELKELGVKYILNITREIDNFYPEEFKYLNVRLYDVPASELMKHWDKTYKFIKEAKLSGKKVLVHCKMGISRSASTVLAYTMKEYNMSLQEALVHVKGKRSVVNPNEGFMQQLKDYEGILKARHNELWGKKAPSRLHPLQVSRKLFHSEPSLLDHAPDSTQIAEPDLSFLPEEDLEHAETPSGKPTGNWASQSHHHSLAVFPPDCSDPVDKRENIRSFLASLPPVVTIDDDQGIGENLYNSESGSGYSTPNFSPTDDEQFNLRFSKLSKEFSKRNKSGSVESNPKECDQSNHNMEVEEKLPASTCLPSIKTEGQASSDSEIQESTQKQSLNIPPKPAPPAEPKPRAASCDGLISSLERRQPIAAPVRIPFTIKTVGIESAVTNEEPSSMSPNVSFSSNSGSLTGMEVGQSPPVIISTDEIDGVNDESIQPQNPSFHLGSAESETKSESTFEETTSPICHRRIKSDTLNATGPIKSPQIQSVPERVKEIEQLNSKSSKVESMETDSHPILTGNKQNLEAVDTLQIISRNSSVNSLLSCASKTSCSCEDELEHLEEVPSEQSSHSPLNTTRHESLSPSPPSVSKISEHVRHSSMYNISTVQSGVDINRRSVSLSQSNPATLSEPLTPPLVGAVKARVLTIEEKNVRDARKHSLTSEKSDTSSSLRSTSPIRQKSLRDQVPQRPASVAVDGTEIHHVGHASISDDLELKSKKSHSRVFKAMPRMSRRDSTPPAIFSAWCNWIPAEDIPPPPVHDLKRKFEDSDKKTTPRSLLRRSQSLRTVEAPKNISRRSGTSSPDQRSRVQYRYTKN